MITVLSLLALAAMILLANIMPPTEEIAYSDFQKYLDAGKVAKVTVSDDAITGELSEGLPSGATSFRTNRVAPSLAAELSRRGVLYSGVPSGSGLATLLSWVVPPLIFVGVWRLAARGMARGGLGGGLLSTGRSKAKLVAEADVEVTFDDVAGVDEAKEELREIVDFLAHPEVHTRLGAHIPRGILLVGPPVPARRCWRGRWQGRPGFHSIRPTAPSSSRCSSASVRLGCATCLSKHASRLPASSSSTNSMRWVAPVASARSPGWTRRSRRSTNCSQRWMGSIGQRRSSFWRPRTALRFLTRPSFARAGSIGRCWSIDRTRKAGSISFESTLKNLKLALDVRLEDIAALTTGFTGADLANLANEAAVLATRRGADAIGMNDFSGAVERVVAGLEKRSRVLIPKERRVVAYHEMGHALVSLAIPGTDAIQKVSIIPRGIAGLGYTLQRPTEDRFLMGRQELEDKMAVLLGGRAAEILIGGDVSTGAADDLAKATDIARGMVLRFGMDERLGPVAWDTEQGQFLQQPGVFWRPRRFSETTAREIDQAVRTHLDGALARALDILQANREALDAGAAALLARETLSGDEIPRPKVLPTVSPLAA